MKCAPGTYSGNGVEPCVSCAKGSYQSGIGALSCVECTGGKSTYGPGADSADMCVGKIFWETADNLHENSLRAWSSNFSREVVCADQHIKRSFLIYNLLT